MRPTLAAITLAPAGGGVAAVARLIARAASDHWGPDVRLLELMSAASAVTRPSTSARARFAAALLAGTMGRSHPVFFSHLGLARTLDLVPPMWRPPYGVFLHGIEVWQRLPVATMDRLRRAAVLVANSDYTVSRFHALNPGAPAVEVCPLALTPEWTTEAARFRRPDDPPAGRQVLVVGRLAADERYKGHDQLLEAWPEVLRAVPEARLVVAGDGDDLPRLRAKSRDLGIAHAVEFRGFASDEERSRLYREATVFAMPSRGEGFGLVSLEAMAHGLPCIGSRHDAAGEIIVDGVTGYLVDQADVRTLAVRLTQLLVDEGAGRALGDAGRTRVLSTFAYERFRDQLVPLVESISERGTRRAYRGSPA